MSLSLEYDVTGLEEVQAGFEILDRELVLQVYNRLLLWAQMVKEEATLIVPVKTGYLRSTIFADVQGWVVRLGASASYALFVEMGTQRMMARPYMVPAIQMFLPRLEQVILEAIDLAKGASGL